MIYEDINNSIWSKEDGQVSTTLREKTVSATTARSD